MKIYIYSDIVAAGVAININILSLQMRWKVYLINQTYSPVHIQNDSQIATEFIPPPQVSDITLK